MWENRTCEVTAKIFKTSLTVLSFTNSPTTPLNLSASFRSCRFWWCGTFPVWWSQMFLTRKQKYWSHHSVLPEVALVTVTSRHHVMVLSPRSVHTKWEVMLLHSTCYFCQLSQSIRSAFFCHQPQWRKFVNYWCDTGTQLLSDSTDLSAVTSQTKAHVIPWSQPAWILIKRLK